MAVVVAGSSCGRSKVVVLPVITVPDITNLTQL